MSPITFIIRFFFVTSSKLQCNVEWNISCCFIPYISLVVIFSLFYILQISCWLQRFSPHITPKVESFPSRRTHIAAVLECTWYQTLMLCQLTSIKTSKTKTNLCSSSIASVVTWPTCNSLVSVIRPPYRQAWRASPTPRSQLIHYLSHWIRHCIHHNEPNRTLNSTIWMIVSQLNPCLRRHINILFTPTSTNYIHYHLKLTNI
jgi:hypothetical protein